MWPEKCWWCGMVPPHTEGSAAGVGCRPVPCGTSSADRCPPPPRYFEPGAGLQWGRRRVATELSPHCEGRPQHPGAPCQRKYLTTFFFTQIPITFTGCPPLGLLSLFSYHTLVVPSLMMQRAIPSDSLRLLGYWEELKTAFFCVWRVFTNMLFLPYFLKTDSWRVQFCFPSQSIWGYGGEILRLRFLANVTVMSTFWVCLVQKEEPESPRKYS